VVVVGQMALLPQPLVLTLSMVVVVEAHRKVMILQAGLEVPLYSEQEEVVLLVQ